MTWIGEIAGLRREIMKRLEQLPLSLFGWTLTAKSSAMGDADTVQTSDTTEGQRPGRRLEPWGHRGRPPGKVRSFWVRFGTSNVIFLGVAPSKGYGPSDLEDGETAVYNATKALVRLWKTGRITMAADNAPVEIEGQNVVVNGGTKAVSRVGDDLTASAALKAWAAIVEGVVNGVVPGSFTIVNSFSAALPGAPGAAGGLGTINSGADHFKG